MFQNSDPKIEFFNVFFTKRYEVYDQVTPKSELF